MMYVFKGHIKNAIFKKTATKFVTILTKCIFHIWTLEATLIAKNKFFANRWKVFVLLETKPVFG